MTNSQDNTDQSTVLNDTSLMDINQGVEALLKETRTDTSGDELDDQAAPNSNDAANDQPDGPNADATDNDDETAPLEANEAQADDHSEEADEGGDEDQAIFEVDGTQVTLEEARLGYLRQSDYTRKTSELADGRKATEATNIQLAAERQHYQQMLEAVKQQLSGDNQEPDWITLEQTSDPVEVLQAKERWRDQQDRIRKLEDEGHRVKLATQAHHDDERLKYVTKEREALLVAIPEWQDTAVAATEQTEIRKFMAELGFSEEEAGDVLDHRVVKALRFGLRGWKMETSQKPLAKKKAAEAKPMKGRARSAPKSKQSQRHRQATERFNKSGDIHDAVAMMLEGEKERSQP